VKKKLLLLASGAAVIAAPAHARDGQPYVGIDAGFVLGSDVDFDLESPVEEERSARLDRSDDVDLGIVAGYDFGPFRLEADLSRRSQSPRQLESITPAFRNSARVPFGTNVLEYGHSRVLALMLNGLLEFGSDDGITVFGGGGVGIADVNIEAGSNAIGTPIDDSSTGFAYQGLFGARVPVSDDLDFGVKYRYFQAEDVSLITSFGAEIEPSYETHSFLASLVYNFGAPTPPPPPPPPPPPCNTGPYIVFFDFDESVITSDAATILDNAVTAYANCGTASVMLAGHTDRSGSNAYNEALAERRNASVNQYLTGRGIPAGRISSQAFGETQNRVPTEDGVRELQNRRVEVTYGPGSGM
jgi:opacity protein-like surface antigen